MAALSRPCQFLLRMTEDQDDYVRRCAGRWQEPINTAIGQIIDEHRAADAAVPDDGAFRLMLSARARAYVDECADQWGVTPEHAIQSMILASYLNTQPPKSPRGPQGAPAAPAPPRNPGGTRRERGARGQTPRRTTPPAPARLDTWAAGQTFSHIDDQPSITDPDQ
jgi:hypothetical protein